MQAKRMEMCAALWAQGVKAEFGYKAAPTIKDALGYADDNGVPFVVLFGESELASASVKVRLLPRASSSCHYHNLTAAKLGALHHCTVLHASAMSLLPGTPQLVPLVLLFRSHPQCKLQPLRFH